MSSGVTEDAAVIDKEMSGKELDDNDDDDDDDDDEDDDPDDDDGETGQVEVDMDEWRTVSFGNLLEWLQDNELIESGHRPQLHNFYTCLLSVFNVHSETGNIWTHLIG